MLVFLSNVNKNYINGIGIGKVRVIDAILARVQTYWGERAAKANSHAISYKNRKIYLSTFFSFSP